MSILAEGRNTEMETQAQPAGPRPRRIPDIVKTLLKGNKLAEAERFLEKIGTIGGRQEAELCFASALLDIQKKKYGAAEKELCRCLETDPDHESARRKLLHLLYPYKKKCSPGTAKALIAAGDRYGREKQGDTKLKREFLVSCCLGEYEKAFRAGELLLKGRLLGATELTTPWEEYFTPSRKLYLTHYNILRGLKLPVSLKIWQVYYLSRLSSALEYPAPFDPLRKRLPKAAPKYGWMYLTMGMSDMASSRYAEALKCLNKVLSALPNDWLARCLRGETYISMGNNKKAFTEFTLAAGDPGNAGVLWNIYTWEGQMRLLCGNYRQAYLRSDAALKLRYETMPLGWKGAAALMLGRTKEALDCLNLVVRQKPGDLEARVWRAEAYLRRRDFKKALEDLEYVLRTDKRSLWAYLNRAILNYRAGNYAEMKKDYFRFESLLAGQDNGSELAARTRPPGCRAIYEMLLRTHKSARGNRRNESHLFPLLRRTGKTLPAAK